MVHRVLLHCNVLMQEGNRVACDIDASLALFFAFSNAQCGEIFFKRVLIIPIPLYFNRLHFRQESLKKPFCENTGM